MEGTYYEGEESYNAAKTALEVRQREANEKSYNKATAQAAKALDALAAAKARDTAAKAAVATIDGAIAKLNTSLEQFTKDYNANQ